MKFSFNTKHLVGYLPPLRGWCPVGRDRGSSFYRVRTVQPGEEYYMFLTQVAIDDTMDYLLPMGHYEKTGGFFKIANGKVEDEGNFWGLGELPTEESFKKLLEEKAAVQYLDSWDNPAVWNEK